MTSGFPLPGGRENAKRPHALGEKSTSAERTEFKKKASYFEEKISRRFTLLTLKERGPTHLKGSERKATLLKKRPSSDGGGSPSLRDYLAKQVLDRMEGIAEVGPQEEPSTVSGGTLFNIWEKGQLIQQIVERGFSEKLSGGRETNG